MGEGYKAGFMMEKSVPPDLVVVAQLRYKFLAIPAAGIIIVKGTVRPDWI